MNANMPERAAPPRSAVPVDHTWRLEDIYPSIAAWEKDLEGLDAQIEAIAAHHGRIAAGPVALLACLQARDALMEQHQRLSVYAQLSTAADGTSPQNQAMSAQIAAIDGRVTAALAFLAGELQALPPGTIGRYLASETRLAPYLRQLELIEMAGTHTPGPEVERALGVMGMLLGAPRAIRNQTMAADVVCAPVLDSTGTTIPVSVARWGGRLSRSPDRELRKRAYTSLSQELDHHKNGLAAALAAQVGRNVGLARLQGYRTVADMVLAPQGVPVEAYLNILEVIHDRMAPHVRRLVQLRQRVLGLDAVRFYDLVAPLDPDYEARFSFEEGGRLVREALRPLGDEYGAMVEAAFRDRWIDRPANEGKRGGGFCVTAHGVHPFVFMTWQDQLRDVFTAAHELGHAGHQTFASRHQAVSNTPNGMAFSTPFRVPPLAHFWEVPSTLNELLLGLHLRETTDDRRHRRFVTEQFLMTFIHNMVTHLLEAHFERHLYEWAESGRPLTTQTVLRMQAEVFERFYGNAVDLNEGASLYWMQQPHFYIAEGVYPYSYAAGLACAFAVLARIQHDGQPAVQSWLDTLRLGATLPPLALAQRTGVDMTSAETLEGAPAFFGTLVDELEESYSR